MPQTFWTVSRFDALLASLDAHLTLEPDTCSLNFPLGKLRCDTNLVLPNNKYAKRFQQSRVVSPGPCLCVIHNQPPTAHHGLPPLYFGGAYLLHLFCTKFTRENSQTGKLNPRSVAELGGVGGNAATICFGCRHSANTRQATSGPECSHGGGPRFSQTVAPRNDNFEFLVGS